MKLLITENRLVSVYQKLIDNCIGEMVDIADNPGNVPDWVDPYVLDDFDSIGSIKVTDAETYNEEYPAFTILVIKIHADVILDSIKFFDLDNLKYHLEYYLKSHMFGRDRTVQLNVLFDNVELKNKNPQW